MSRLAIIPARGGSKRVRRKNIAPVEGRPMLVYPAGTALACGLFDLVIVSTEDPEIAEIAAGTGAEVLARPRELAQDRSTVVEVCLHALGALEAQGRTFAEFCCVYATAIFLRSEDLHRSHAMLEAAPAADVVMGVSEYPIHPVKALLEKDAFLERMWPQYAGMKSQAYPRVVASNGTLYWARVPAFRESRTFYVKRLKGYVLPWDRAIDIDVPENLELARLIAAAKGMGEG